MSNGKRTCECSMRTKVVGDGCEVCNPAQALEYAKASITECAAEIRRLEAEVARLKTVPMKYRRMEFNAQLQKECDELSAQLKALEEQEPFGFVREIRPGDWKFSKTSSWPADVWKPVYAAPVVSDTSQAERDELTAKVAELEAGYAIRDDEVTGLIGMYADMKAERDELSARNAMLREALVRADAAWGQPAYPSIMVEEAIALPDLSSDWLRKHDAEVHHAALEEVAVLATVGATYPEIMEFLKAELEEQK